MIIKTLKMLFKQDKDSYIVSKNIQDTISSEKENIQSINLLILIMQ